MPPLWNTPWRHSKTRWRAATPLMPPGRPPASSLLLSPPSSGRPGSNARPVLPPIPPGRKTPSHSPSPSPATLPDLGPRP
ncbi:MAPK-interacting and spindle-stabilizing protein-like [Hypomesus transpacificus]|uniref:MAPK-interacting and spindle-stabilizing protein-like n=1 Tax=Hypomesus transpacificus TaxID=137520 RepID=UPI001F07E858|nr:MAPK-interacting and spindle-stabilizing protein-like [Hypomesus transpacificus]